MTRLRSTIATFAVLIGSAVVLAACGSGGSPAATVNGVDLSDSDFRSELEVLRDHPEFAQAAFGAIVPAEGATVDADVAANVLQLRITVELVDQEFEARGLELTDEAYARADETFQPALLELLDEMPDDYRDRFRGWNAQLIMLRDELEAEAAGRSDEITEAEVEAFYDEYQGIFTAEEVCARHILLESEVDAEDAVSELDGGADFGELASDRSTDPSAEINAGDLGCVGRGQYVAEFEEAVWEGPVGEVQGPIETQFGFHVILVESRGAPDFAALEDDIRAFLESPASRDGQQLVGLLIQRLVTTADVSVSSRYGTWNAETSAIDPPDRPTTTAGETIGIPGQ